MKRRGQATVSLFYEKDAVVRLEARTILHNILFDEWLLADLIEEGVVDPPPKSVVGYRVAKISPSALLETF